MMNWHGHHQREGVIHLQKQVVASEKTNKIQAAGEIASELPKQLIPSHFGKQFILRSPACGERPFRSQLSAMQEGPHNNAMPNLPRASLRTKVLKALYAMTRHGMCATDLSL
eukprot:scaffold205972_cov32-Tisochrysis_lutea.AAC.4